MRQLIERILDSILSPDARQPKRSSLSEGAKILGSCLKPQGFRFRFKRGASNDPFVHGEFVKRDRKIELGYGLRLATVQYRIGELWLNHCDYMQCLGALPKYEYRADDLDPLDAFRRLHSDLEEFGGDFVSGSSERFLAAAREMHEFRADFQKKYPLQVKDKAIRQEARDYFRKLEYVDALRLFESINLPDELDRSALKMIEICRKKVHEAP